MEHNKFKTGDKVIAFTGEVGGYVEFVSADTMCHKVMVNGLLREFRAWDIGPFTPR